MSALTRGGLNIAMQDKGRLSYLCMKFPKRLGSVVTFFRKKTSQACTAGCWLQSEVTTLAGSGNSGWVVRIAGMDGDGRRPEVTVNLNEPHHVGDSSKGTLALCSASAKDCRHLRSGRKIKQRVPD